MGSRSSVNDELLSTLYNISCNFIYNYLLLSYFFVMLGIVGLSLMPMLENLFTSVKCIAYLLTLLTYSVDFKLHIFSLLRISMIAHEWKKICDILQRKGNILDLLCTNKKILEFYLFNEIFVSINYCSLYTANFYFQISACLLFLFFIHSDKYQFQLYSFLLFDIGLIKWHLFSFKCERAVYRNSIYFL